MVVFSKKCVIRFVNRRLKPLYCYCRFLAAVLPTGVQEVEQRRNRCREAEALLQ